MEGRKVGGYPDLVVNIKDEYNSTGIYTISLCTFGQITESKIFQRRF